jgi:hypothetical protein
MKLSKNPTFIKHTVQIEEALSHVSGPVHANGRALFDSMLFAARELDNSITPIDGTMPSQQMITIKRDEFHKSCRDLGEWLTLYAPNLELKWD